MRMPTQAELDAIPVEDSEIEEWLGYVMQLEKALYKARIPQTIDWAIVLLRFAAQSTSLQNMPHQYFRMICDECYNTSNIRHVGKRVLTFDLRSLVDANWKARVSRLAMAIHKSKLSATGPEALFGLVLLPSQIFVRGGAPREIWSEACEEVWAAANHAIHVAAQVNQA